VAIDALYVDLHSHSTASDGAVAPASVIEAAHAAGLGAIALTDHDTMDGIEEARFLQAEEDGVGAEFGAETALAELIIGLAGFFDARGTAQLGFFAAAAFEDAKNVAGLRDFPALERIKLRQSYLPQFGKILPGRTVARFFQIENKIDAVIRYDLASTIPVVEDASSTAPIQFGAPADK